MRKRIDELSVEKKAREVRAAADRLTVQVARPRPKSAMPAEAPADKDDSDASGDDLFVKQNRAIPAEDRNAGPWQRQEQQQQQSFPERHPQNESDSEDDAPVILNREMLKKHHDSEAGLDTSRLPSVSSDTEEDDGLVLEDEDIVARASDDEAEEERRIREEEEEWLR
jgi:hypothetical protein